MTDVEIYQPGTIEPTRLVMTPEAARELDDQLRACTKAVLRPGVDYGVIPGTDGKNVLLKPGAEKLLQWFGFAYTMECVDIERDDDGKKQGVTYRCGIVRRLPDGSVHAIAACEGYAGYEESKFYKSAEQNQAEAKAREMQWAKQYKRDPRPVKWEFVGEYRAPWNTIIKRAQKRALVGATIDATAAAGLFREDEEPGPPPDDDGPTLFRQMLEAAGNFKTVEAGNNLWRAAEGAATAGRITLRQATHIKNKIKPRREQLKTTVVVEAEGLARPASDPSPAAAPPPPLEPAGEAPIPGPAAPEPAAGPGTPGDDQHKRLIGQAQGHFKRLGFTDADRADRLWAAGKLAAVADVESLNDLTHPELNTVVHALARCKDRTALEVLLGAAGGDGNE